MKKLLIIVLVMLMAGYAFAQVNVDVAGKIYNQFRWTDAISSMGAHTEHAWAASRDDVLKGNFVRSEVEFEVNATVSKYVKTYLRIKTIFDADDGNSSVEANASTWQTYWDANTGWFKLRGFRIDYLPPWNSVDVIQLGTPMGLGFSKWFMADRRYIDRDNAKGIYIKGNFGDKAKWNLIRMWQPNWQGWNWNTGDFKAEDGTWALNVNSQPMDNFGIAFDAVWYADTEFDSEDIENPNFAPADTTDIDDPNGIMTTKEIYQAFGFGLSGNYDLSDAVSFGFNGMFTGQSIDDALDADEDNIIDGFGGWEPCPQYASIFAPSFIFNIKTTDPFEIGFSPNLQFFNISHNYVSYWGSRREDDLLMINGGIDGIRNTYGEDLGLNTFLWGGTQNGVRHEFRDNDNLRLGEGLVESPVGYWGGTFDFNYDFDVITLLGQFNYIGRTDDTGGVIDEEDPNFDGPDSLMIYMPAHDFSGMVAEFGLKGKAGKINYGLGFRYGNWVDNKKKDIDDDFARTAMVIQPSFGLQLTDALNFELKPAYMTITDEMTDEIDGDTSMETSNIVISHKWVYNFGGFDFWLRGEHQIKSFDDKVDATEEFDLSGNTLHAAWEVKF
ncbi:MAG: hypothetical protein ISS80_01315 [Candidatus Cloacimonetes bacterium]|nr:hypothetical protein [Candidatus Cloacimonadota bacterium]